MRAKIRSATVKVSETRLNERQLSALASDFYGVLRPLDDVITEWVVDFIDFTHPGTGDKVYSSFCVSSFQRALMAYEIPVTD